MMPDAEDPWRCGRTKNPPSPYCGKHYPVQPLARDCEAGHKTQSQESP